MNESLRSDLASADPVGAREDAKVGELVQRMASAARDASSIKNATLTPWWKRRRVMIPFGITGVVALTGAAVMIPLSLWINDTRVKLDAEIPIVYTTETGVDVSCRYGIYFGDPASRSEDDELIAEFVQNHDWSGIGQRIYDEAIANPFVPGANDHLEVDTQEVRDGFSFHRATSLIWEEIPDDLQQTNQSSGATSDCTGQLR